MWLIAIRRSRAGPELPARSQRAAGCRLPCLVVAEHHAAAIGFDPVKDQLQDAVEHFAQIVGASDRDRGQVHDFQRAVAVGLALRPTQALESDTRVGELGNDSAAVTLLALEHDVDSVCRIHRAGLTRAREDHQRGADLDPIATEQSVAGPPAGR